MCSYARTCQECEREFQLAWYLGHSEKCWECDEAGWAPNHNGCFHEDDPEYGKVFVDKDGRRFKTELRGMNYRATEEIDADRDEDRV